MEFVSLKGDSRQSRSFESSRGLRRIGLVDSTALCTGSLLRWPLGPHRPAPIAGFRGVSAVRSALRTNTRAELRIKCFSEARGEFLRAELPSSLPEFDAQLAHFSFSLSGRTSLRHFWAEYAR